MDLRAEDIMIKDVVTIGPKEIIASAKLRMTRQGIGGLPVVENGEVKGMITHRDIILSGEEVMKLKVEDIMTKEVVVVDRETSLKEIVNLMRETGYQRLPVVEGKRLVGIVTQSCIINALAEHL
jgi:CBS domain-containing protein